LEKVKTQDQVGKERKKEGAVKQRVWAGEKSWVFSERHKTDTPVEIKETV